MASKIARDSLAVEPCAEKLRVVTQNTSMPDSSLVVIVIKQAMRTISSFCTSDFVASNHTKSLPCNAIHQYNELFSISCYLKSQNFLLAVRKECLLGAISQHVPKNMLRDKFYNAGDTAFR